VVVVDLLLALAAGEDHLIGVDDDDVVAAVDMGGVGRLVLAAQPHRHDRREPANDEALRIDHNPLLVDVGGFQRSGFHRAGPVSGHLSPVETTNRRESRGGDGRDIGTKVGAVNQNALCSRVRIRGFLGA
jgi:hypothetical protein